MNKVEFKQIIDDEKVLYLGDDKNAVKQMKKCRHKRYYIWKYLYYFRLCQFNLSLRSDKDVGKIERKLAKFKYRHYNKKKNIYSCKSCVEIGISCNIGKNCDIWHSGVVINADIGDNCTFHGNNILGNKGKGKESLNPTLGNNIDVGAGAVIIGDVTIADGCKIGANALVCKSCDKTDSVLVGVPSRIMTSDTR